MPENTKNRSLLKELFWPVVFVISLYIILPQLTAFHSSLKLLTHPNILDVSIASGLIILTYLSAASTYLLLAVKPLNYVQEVLVQLATMFVNRLLPAGIGGLGANYEYLRHKKHSSSEALSIVVTNNSLGVIAHFLLILLAFLLADHPSSLLPHHVSSSLSNSLKYLLIGAAVIILAGVIIGRKKLKHYLSDFYKQLLSYEHHPYKTLLALASQIVLSAANILGLLFSAQAVGIHLPFGVILIIFTLGSGVRNFTPTPGGLGGFEAGLIASFVAYHVASPSALAATLLYRLISYWIPLVIGLISFIYAKNRGLFKHEAGKTSSD